ncbi:MAG: HpcH/HpaI aldolase family protein [Hyphomicrobiales bacterium]
MRENRMKKMLHADEPAFGCSVMIPSPQVVEIAAYAGFDWVLIDMEHGTIGLESAELMIMAADASGITPIVRPPANTKADISAVMDRGAHGVQVPHVNTADEARAAVRAVKFGPGDYRGLAAGTRPNEYGFAGSISDFVARANENSLVCIQLEHAEAIENIDEILRVDGIDVFFIGPSDLSQSMGHPGNPGAPEVKSAIEKSLAKIKNAGKIPGIPGTTENVQDVLSSGCLYIYTHLPKLFGAGATAFFSNTKRSGK